MVLWDPHAHELVLYKQPGGAASATAAGAAGAASSHAALASFEAHAIPSSMTAAVAAMQPFNTPGFNMRRDEDAHVNHGGGVSEGAQARERRAGASFQAALTDLNAARNVHL